jgi:hypothetical protein
MFPGAISPTKAPTADGNGAIRNRGFARRLDPRRSRVEKAKSRDDDDDDDDGRQDTRTLSSPRPEVVWTQALNNPAGGPRSMRML